LTRAAFAGRSVAAAALLPLRLFLGITYVYAAIDKFASPHFFVADSPFSVAAQMEGFTRISPLAPLIEAAMPAAVPIGALIALGELGIGIGLLTGLAYRLSAWAGVALSILFWLTASWSSTPYFYSPDLPYAFGFLTLALAGHGNLLVIDPWPRRGRDGDTADPAKVVDAGVDAEAGEGTGADADAGDVRAMGAEPSATRRALLQAGILAVLTVFTAGALTRLRALSADESGAAAGTGGPKSTPAPTAAQSAAPAAVATAAATAATSAGTTGTPAPSAAPSAAPATGPTAAPATPAPSVAPTQVPTAVTGVEGPVIATIADLAPNTGVPFIVPNEAPFAQNPGGPGVLVQLADGRFVAYSARCTHGQCTVAYDSSVSELVCPCHLGRFDAANSAAVLGGPPPLPLAEIPVAVDVSGQVHVVLQG
jgi:thiosulfate dehydrogenase (quinone) large subunit